MGATDLVRQGHALLLLEVVTLNGHARYCVQWYVATIHVLDGAEATMSARGRSRSKD